MVHLLFLLCLRTTAAFVVCRLSSLNRSRNSVTIHTLLSPILQPHKIGINRVRTNFSRSPLLDHAPFFFLAHVKLTMQSTPMTDRPTEERVLIFLGQRRRTRHYCLTPCGGRRKSPSKRELSSNQQGARHHKLTLSLYLQHRSGLQLVVFSTSTVYLQTMTDDGCGGEGGALEMHPRADEAAPRGRNEKNTTQTQQPMSNNNNNTVCKTLAEII